MFEWRHNGNQSQQNCAKLTHAALSIGSTLILIFSFQNCSFHNPTANLGESESFASETDNALVIGPMDLKAMYLSNDEFVASVEAGDSYQIVLEVSNKYSNVSLEARLTSNEFIYSPDSQQTRSDGWVEWIDTQTPADKSKGWRFISYPITASLDMSALIVATPYTSLGTAGSTITVDLPIKDSNAPVSRYSMLTTNR